MLVILINKSLANQ